MALIREINALAAVLSDPDNQDKSPEDIAEEIITALDDLRSQTHRLAVVAQYQWTGGEPTVAVLGPFSTRAPGAARAVGGGMAGTAQGGSGRFMLVPAYANVRAAWDAVKPASKEEKRLERFLASVHREAPTTWGPMSGYGPTCCCGVKAGSWCLVHKKSNPPRAA
jgi:hypothetical protein